MGVILLAVFIGVPILEIALFIEVGDRIGLGPTLAIVILTAVAGTALLRSQGLATLKRAQASLEAGRFPLDEVFDGLCLVLAGALLLTPGFFTDVVGLSLFVPPFRRLLRGLASAYLVSSGRVSVHARGFHSGLGPDMGPEPGSGSVIDGEFEDITPGEDKKSRNRDSLPPEKKPDSN